MTIAVGLACIDTKCTDEKAFKKAVIDRMHELGAMYPDAGYGGNFHRWLFCRLTQPYNSFGNGSAMRVSSVAWIAETLEQAEQYAEWSAEVTHNHPEGIKGAQAVAAAIFLARNGSLGGDADTQAAITGSIAEAFYGIAEDLSEKIFEYLDDTLTEYYWRWHHTFLKD